ncbi:hypothetical protein BN115_0525 [Bordetella bronchiseptica MO149]|uniref:hypothetical protein n=2 Tax=Bordetella bronchiseptica TaxID=518 RepID=UPI00028B79AA|nr:hypothetical protein [Bordetella bronchiseptica]AWQ03709.1 hypothetical protein B9G73_02795 [Bordetella bronchiseptica]CCJ57281.1 hypothetical protein BN115_0525 [Bordetella bronchiseptica MO149]
MCVNCVAGLFTMHEPPSPQAGFETFKRLKARRPEVMGARPSSEAANEQPRAPRNPFYGSRDRRALADPD